MGWLDDALKFEVSRTKDIFKGIKNDPKRLVLGVDGPSTALWNGILGRDDKPVVGMLGAPTEQNYQNAQARGIDTGPARTMNTAAQMVAALYGGQALGALGAGAGGTGGAGGAAGSAATGSVAGSGAAPVAASGAGNWAQYAGLARNAAGAMQPQPATNSPPPINNPNTAQSRPVIQPPAAGPGPVATGNPAADQRRRIALAQALRGVR
jgi:hypothetical protein